eukprot:PhM_4_TR9788/c0_g1_i2/m.76759
MIPTQQPAQPLQPMQPKQPLQPQQPQQPASAASSSSSSKWVCPKCQMSNNVKERKCFACDLQRPNDPELERVIAAEQQKKARAHMEAQERVKYEHDGRGWVCTNCNSVSSPDVFECARCGHLRPYNTPEERQAMVMYLKAKKARFMADIAASQESTTNTSFALTPKTEVSPARATLSSKPKEIRSPDGATGFEALSSEMQNLMMPAPHSGKLKMQHDGLLMKTMKDRMCEIRGPYLYYFKVKDTLQPKDRIRLNEPGVEVVEEDAARFRFRIRSVVQNKDYVFMDSDASSYAMWVRKVREAMTFFAGKDDADVGLYLGEGGEYKELILFPTNCALKNLRYTLDDFDLLRLIGKGSFGKVITVRNRQTSEILAMKVLRKEAITKPKEVLAEKAVLQVVEHPFIVKLHAAFQTHSKLFLVMSYLPNGDMKYHMRKDAPFSEARVRFYAAQVMLMLETLHSNRIVYRDLKPDNLVLDSDGYAVLTDMGLARDMTEDQLRTFCGTPLYMAPELVDRKGYDYAVDWWAYGIIVYEMLVGVTPFADKTIHAVFNRLRSTEVRYPDAMSPEARDFVGRLLQKDPKRRLVDPDAMRSHPFFDGVEWDRLVERKVPAPPFHALPSEALSQSALITEQQAAEIKRDDRGRHGPHVDAFLGFSGMELPSK